MTSQIKEYDPTAPSIHPTRVAAQKLGVKADTIRTYKTRYAAHLEENIHWAKDPNDGSIWWTEQGIELLSRLGPGAKEYTANLDPNLLKRDALQTETECVADFETGCVSELETPDVSCDDAVLDRLAAPLAVEQLRRRLAPRVDAEYERLIAALGHLFQHPEQHPDPGIEQLLEMVGVSIATVRMMNGFAAFNVDAARIVSEARASLREGQL